MKNYAKTLLLVAATCFALVSTSKAQLVTYETISSWTNSVQTFTANQFFAQTFTGVTEVQSMTYRFASSSNSFGSLNLTATFVEWNGGSSVGTAVGTTVQSVGTITIPGSSSWSYDNARSTYYYDYQIVLNQATSGTQTYAMLLQTSTGGSPIGLSYTNTDAFSYGTLAQQYPGSFVLANPFQDWGFAQLVVAPVVPTPESGTMAAIAGAVLVAGLVGLRLRQRRQLALVPVTAA
ncbi:MAG: hypothetical protein JSS11_15985 [Verrucomicrobia bacterium]|nr:hypothetical protein [Verrucomicrobiota bacterium]